MKTFRKMAKERAKSGMNEIENGTGHEILRCHCWTNRFSDGFRHDSVHFPLVCHITVSVALFPSISVRDFIHFSQGSHAYVHTYLYVKFPCDGLEISLSGR